jgi:ABC-type iron transport system FetAB permease component
MNKTDKAASKILIWEGIRTVFEFVGIYFLGTIIFKDPTLEQWGILIASVIGVAFVGAFVFKKAYVRGLLAVIGIVFIVLTILDFTTKTDDNIPQKIQEQTHEK